MLMAHASAADLAAGAAAHASYVGLVRALGNVLLVVALGYFVRWRGAPGAETLERGLGAYVASFALPVTLFLALATQVDLHGIGWELLSTLTLGKALVFALAALSAALFGSSADVDAAAAASPEGAALGEALARAERLKKAGMWGIAATQSNDLPIGLPLVASLLPGGGYEVYLYLIAIPQMLLLNPLGYALMELGQAKADAAREEREEEGLGGGNEEAQLLLGGQLLSERRPRRRRRRSLLLPLLGRTLVNPLVLGALLGMLYNAALGRTLPPFFDSLCTMVAASFAPTSLFLLGASMYGKVGQAGSKMSAMLLPLWLAVLKLVVLPVVSREVAAFMPGLSANCKMFALVYGCIPVAPSVFVYARQYAVHPTTIALYVVLCLVASAPLMLVQSLMLTDASLESLGEAVGAFRVWCHALSAAACAYLLTAASLSPRWRTRGVHATVVVAAAYQLLFDTSFMSCLIVPHGQAHMLAREDIYAVENVARVLARCSSALLAPALLALSAYPRVVLSPGWRTHAALWTVSLAINLPLRLWGVPDAPDDPRAAASSAHEPCYVAYGRAQTAVTLAYDSMLLACVGLLLVCAEFRMRREHKRRASASFGSFADLVELDVSAGADAGVATPNVGAGRYGVGPDQVEAEGTQLLPVSYVPPSLHDVESAVAGLHARPTALPHARGRAAPTPAGLGRDGVADRHAQQWEWAQRADDVRNEVAYVPTRMRTQVYLVILMLDVMLQMALNVSNYVGTDVQESKLYLALIFAMAFNDGRGLLLLGLFALQSDVRADVRAAATTAVKRVRTAVGAHSPTPSLPGSPERAPVRPPQAL